ncbi:MAG TPA: cupin domain-containing protein [Candidatus Dormibacteraeota bacterium]|nr:cupin domain-containing protein [Candidatus Dormibacteraeota bacterium]
MTDTIVNPITGYTITFLEATEVVFRFREIALPSTYGPALHIHPLQEERFEIIRGSVEFVMGARKVVCGPGESVVVPAGVAHTFKNVADCESEMFAEYRPGLPQQSRRFFEVYFALARARLTDSKGLPSIWQIAVEMPTMSDHVRLASPPWAVQRLVLAMLRPIAWLMGCRPFELEPRNSILDAASILPAPVDSQRP